MQCGKVWSFLFLHGTSPIRLKISLNAYCYVKLRKPNVVPPPDTFAKWNVKMWKDHYFVKLFQKWLFHAVVKIIYESTTRIYAYVVCVEAINEIANHLVSLCKILSLLFVYAVRSVSMLFIIIWKLLVWWFFSCLCISLSLVHHASIRYTICGICVGFV